MVCKIGTKGPKFRWAISEEAPLTWTGSFAVLFSDVELPESGGMVASADATDEEYASTDEVETALVGVEGKTVEADDKTVETGETNKEVAVE